MTGAWWVLTPTGSTPPSRQPPPLRFEGPDCVVVREPSRVLPLVGVLFVHKPPGGRRARYYALSASVRAHVPEWDVCSRCPPACRGGARVPRTGRAGHELQGMCRVGYPPPGLPPGLPGCCSEQTQVIEPHPDPV